MRITKLSVLFLCGLISACSLKLSSREAEAFAANSNQGAPSVGSIDPAAGPTSGGNIVTLTGNNFASGARVFFGDALALNVQLVSAKKLSATAPAHDAGAVTIRVYNPN